MAEFFTIQDRGIQDCRIQDCRSDFRASGDLLYRVTINALGILK